MIEASLPDHLRVAANKARGKRGPVDVEKLKALLPKTVGEKPIIVGYRQVVDRQALVGAAFMLEAYFADTFMELLRQNAHFVQMWDQSLKAKEKFEGGEFDSYEEAIVRTHHRELNFQSPEKLVALFGKFDLRPFVDDKVRQRVAELFAERHLVVHRGGIVNKEHVNKVLGVGPDKIGALLEISPDKVDKALALVWGVVFDFERQILTRSLICGAPVVARAGEAFESRIHQSLDAYLSRGG